MSLFGFEPTDEELDGAPESSSENRNVLPELDTGHTDVRPDIRKPVDPELEADLEIDDADAIDLDLLNGFENEYEHLNFELFRINLLIKAQFKRWQDLIADNKPEKNWGMIQVTDAEVNRYLNADLQIVEPLSSEQLHSLNRYWIEADQLHDVIETRVGKSDIELPLERLAYHFNLRRQEMDILLLAFLPETDARYRRIYGYLQDDASRTKPKAELLLEMIRAEGENKMIGRQLLSPEGTLRANHLVTLTPQRSGEEGLSLGSVMVDPHIVNMILGDVSLDDRLEGEWLEPDEMPSWDELILPDDRRSSYATLTTRLKADEISPVFLLQGSYGSGRRDIATAVCQQLEVPLIIVDSQVGLDFSMGWEQFVSLAYREAKIKQAAILWTHCEKLLGENHTQQWQGLIETAESFSGITFLATTIGWELMGNFRSPAKPLLQIALPLPNYDLREKLWQRYLSNEKLAPELDVILVSQTLANSFQFNGGQIEDALATARWIALQDDPATGLISEKNLFDGCRKQASRQIIKMARRVQPRDSLTLDSVILPSANKVQLEELIFRVQNQNTIYSTLDFGRQQSLGKGLIALFVGSSGTGKTLTAELLASIQGVDLYKVDLSVVVSKYVGETEKNLDRVFSEAEGANAILFFDEADALFGKRGEVKDARDRWANMEINFLLQRIEEYDGVVILATNLRQNIDEAFARRIQVIVEFPFPEGEHRKEILFRLFPNVDGLVPPAKETLDEVASKFKLAGGNWKNIVIDATYRALADKAEGEPVTVTKRHLLASIAREFQKQGKPLTPGEFGKRYYEWVKEDILNHSEKQEGVQK